MGGSQSQSGCYGDEINLLPLPRSKPSCHKAHSLITILTMPMKDVTYWGVRTERNRKINTRKEIKDTAGGLHLVTIIYL
jgi:hypothetical protein